MSLDTDVVRVSTEVRVSPDRAFVLFTEEIDEWWRDDPRYRQPTDRRFYFEPGPKGRLLVEQLDGPPFEVGRVLDWSPGKRLEFEWRARTFEAGECTRVELRFERTDDGTRITLSHSGWDGVALDHPVRHGMVGDAFRDFFGVWWADLLVSLQRESTAQTLEGRES